MRILLLLLSLSGFSSLTAQNPDKIISNAIKAHGGASYEQAHYQFVFRGNTFEFKNDGARYYYKSIIRKDDKEIINELDNDGFKQTINGQLQELSERQITGYGNSLNSVIYFATLPHKLKDEAVRKKYMGKQTIKGKEYEVVQVTFVEEGGGTDHDDSFHYWINRSNNEIDYLAYDYQVNKGGVRFRTAENKRRVDGILFQDYVNYKAEVGTALIELPALWEKGQLKELSQIKTEEVLSLR